MIWLYLAALVFGAAFVVPMVMGGLDFDADVELDFDADGDLGNADSIEVGDVDSDGAVSGVGDFVQSLLSFRSMVFFASFFGLSGVIFELLDFNFIVTLLTASALGFLAAGLNAAAFQYLLGHEVDSSFTNQDLSGRPARVVLPLADGRKGRIRLDISGQPQYLVALPFQGVGGEFAVGDSVVVVEIENATAFVAPLMELEGEEL